MCLWMMSQSAMWSCATGREWENLNLYVATCIHIIVVTFHNYTTMKTSSIFMKANLAIVLFGLLALTQCKKETIDAYDCTGVAPTYTTDVKSILDASCATSGCHNASSAKGGYNLSTYQGAQQAAGKEAFLGSIQHKSGFSKMPRGGSKLAETNIKLISCWVQNGMPE